MNILKQHNLIILRQIKILLKDFKFFQFTYIEKLLQKIGLQNYMVVAIDQDTQNSIKEEYNSKTKKYNYVDDTQITNMLSKQEQNNDKKIALKTYLMI